LNNQSDLNLDLNNIPKHIAIIMDGNGRWAKNHNLSRAQGHMEGVKRAEEIVDFAHDIGVKVLTLFTFSTENWSRPKTEISSLMGIIGAILNKKMNKLRASNIKFQIIGSRKGIPQSVLRAIELVCSQTQNNTGIIMNLAFNYGSRKEIIEAIKTIAQRVENHDLSIDDIDEQLISDSLYTRNLPDPDLLVRTSGEKRISNFLLWQLSYAELYFTEKFWPEFTKEELTKAIYEYQHRERRFGSVMESNISL